MDRMLAMAWLDHPHGSPFIVGEEQLTWLKKDLEKIDRGTSAAVSSHSTNAGAFPPHRGKH